MWKYYFSKRSIKELDRSDTHTSDSIKQEIKNIGDWLNGESALLVDIKKLKGKWKGYFRLRSGKTRVIFSFDKDDKIIKIHDIGSRGDIY